jgi:hypothetical protein
VSIVNRFTRDPAVDKDELQRRFRLTKVVRL